MTVRTYEELQALYADQHTRSIGADDGRDVIDTLFKNAGYTYIKTGGQGFNGPNFTEDNDLRFPILQPFVYTFQLIAFFEQADAPKNAQMTIRTGVLANCRVQDYPDDELTDCAEPNPQGFPLSTTSQNGISVVGYVDPFQPGASEAVLLWKAGDDGSMGVVQGSMLRVWRYSD